MHVRAMHFFLMCLPRSIMHIRFSFVRKEKRPSPQDSVDISRSMNAEKLSFSAQKGKTS